MRHAHPISRAGFSLIEVLIAVVVLAFGLLGLAAVFPAVVKQQTTAKDSVQGVSVLRSAEELLRGNTRLNQYRNDSADLQQIENRIGWETILAETTWHNDANQDGGPARYPEIIVPTGGIMSSNRSGVIYDSANGDLAIGRPRPVGNEVREGIVIPLAQRLFPAPYTNEGARPEYVWDVVARRVDTGLPHSLPGTSTQFVKYEDDSIELVIFVRRIDPGIRVNRTGNYPLAWALADALMPPTAGAGSPAKLALSERADGTPTLDGAGIGSGGRYSTPKRVRIDFPDANRMDAITVSPATGDTQTGLVSQAQQVGQALVDTLGTIHRVREVQTRNPVNNNAWPQPRLIVEPAFDTKVLEWNPASSDVHVVFTTQIPAAVGVIRIDPRKGGRL